MFKLEDFLEKFFFVTIKDTKEQVLRDIDEVEVATQVNAHNRGRWNKTAKIIETNRDVLSVFLIQEVDQCAI